MLDRNGEMLVVRKKTLENEVDRRLVIGWSAYVRRLKLT